MPLKIHEAPIVFLNVIQLNFTSHADNMKSLTTPISQMLTLRFHVVCTLLTSVIITIEVHFNCVININRQTHVFVKKEALTAILPSLLHTAYCGNPARQHWD